MPKRKVGAIATQIFALLVVLGTGHHATAQDATTPYPTPYPKMAPIEQYLMDRDAEIAPPLSVFLVVVDKWSDGTPALSM